MYADLLRRVAPYVPGFAVRPAGALDSDASALPEAAEDTNAETRRRRWI